MVKQEFNFPGRDKHKAELNSKQQTDCILPRANWRWYCHTAEDSNA